jgi:tetratricopeptide (TPR) repeat protein
MHDLVRLYAAEQPVSQSERSTALTGLVNYYTYGAYAVDRQMFPHRSASVLAHVPAGPVAFEPPDADAALAWFRAEHQCLIATSRLAMRMGWHAVVWQLAWYLTPVRWRQGCVPEDADAWRMAVDAAEHMDNTVARAHASRGLGMVITRLGRHEDALPHLRLALDLLSTMDRPLEQAIAHSSLANVLRNLEHFPEALTHAERALALLEPLGKPVLTAQARSQVGEVLVYMRENEAGRAKLEQALAVFREHGDTDSESITLSNIAQSLHQQDRSTEALAIYRTVLGLYAANGNTYFMGSAHDRIGDILLALGDRDGAAESWRRALELHVASHQVIAVQRIEPKLAALS